MKAFLLAGGLGTRLRPLTDKIPKCLIPICGRPLLDWWYLSFRKYGITDVLINLHHFSDMVKDYIQKNFKGVNFVFYEEPILLGSAGTLRENKDFVYGEKEFFVIYADNLTNYNLLEFLEFHRSSHYEFSMALFKTDTPHSKGIALLDNEKIITSFEEKPQIPRSNLANAGIYISHPNILNYIPYKKVADIGFDLLPKLVNKMRGWVTENYLIDIGIFQHLKLAEKEWLKIIGENNDV